MHDKMFEKVIPVGLLQSLILRFERHFSEQRMRPGPCLSEFLCGRHCWACADKLIVSRHGRTDVGERRKKSGPEFLTCVAAVTFLESAPRGRGCVGPDQYSLERDSGEGHLGRTRELTPSQKEKKTERGGRNTVTLYKIQMGCVLKNFIFIFILN